MGKAKNLLEEAIAEAKVVRAAAIKNATKQLEENLTPSIKEMLANKLEEELDLNEEVEEESLDENANSGFKEVKPKGQKVNEAEDDDADADAEDADVDAADADAAADDADAAADDADADADAADADADAADADAAVEDEEAADDDTPLKDITLGDLKNIISDLVAAAAAPAPGGDMGADMDPGDVEGMGDENPDAAVDAPVDAPADAPADGDVPTDPTAGDNKDDEIDISEILRELEEEEKGNKKDVCPECGNDPCTCKNLKEQDGEGPAMTTEKTGAKWHDANESLKGQCQDEELRKENQELREGLQKCLNTLKEVNLLNTKLKVTTKLLSKTGLTESQKANIIRTVDGAKNAKEAVALGKTLLEGLKNTKKPLTEGRKGSASKPAGSSTAPKKSENQMIDEGMVYRFQQLAGIIKD